MADKKVTIMVIKVDLGCEKCYAKIKKILCKIPQIQNQLYDEKNNTVTITVVCCSPEKIKKKICSKGGDTIKGIEIVVPKPPAPTQPEKPKEKPKEPEKPKEKPKEPEKPKEKPKEPEKPKEKPKEPEKPKENPKEPEKPKEKPKEPEKPKEKPKEPEKPKEKPKEPEKSKEPEKPPKAPEPEPTEVIPECPQPPIRACCMECYGGHGGGPCWDGCGRPASWCDFGTPAAPPCYEPYGRPVYDSWGSGGYGYTYGGCRRGCYVGRCDCLSDENPSACSIM